ncbi:MAG: APC family permease, partial [Gemmatimonadota bacterium]|nr:APC family permease [Gemmatimonadota bacterium]
ITPDRFSWFPQMEISTPGGMVELGLSPQRLVALVSIWVLTWINLRGVKEGKIVQTSLTLAKTGALALLILLGLTIGRNSDALAANFSPGQFMGQVDVTGAFVIAFGAALVGSLFSSDAWNNVTFAAAEVHNPKRNLPLALAIGTGLVTLLYIMANVAYLNTLPFAGAENGNSVLERGITYATQDRVGTASAEVIFGSGGSVLMAVAILVSTFGCNNGLILAGARVYYAMARDGLFFRKVGQLNARRVPAAGLVLQSVWTSLLCLTGTYGQLLDYVIFAALIFYVLTTIGLFILRRTRPDAERPYRAIGYPVLPALYILLASAVAVILLLSKTTQAQALSGLVLVLVGIPVFYLWRQAAPPGPVARP